MLINWLWRKPRAKELAGAESAPERGSPSGWGRQLEERCVPSVYTWQGGTTDSNGYQDWSTAANWLVGGSIATTAPGNGDQLVFPSGTANPTTNDDLNVTLGSISFQGAGYTVLNMSVPYGYSPAIYLASGGSITASGSSLIGPIQLAGAATFENTVSGSQNSDEL